MQPLIGWSRPDERSGLRRQPRWHRHGWCRACATLLEQTPTPTFVSLRPTIASILNASTLTLRYCSFLVGKPRRRRSGSLNISSFPCAHQRLQEVVATRCASQPILRATFGSISRRSFTVALGTTGSYG